MMSRSPNIGLPPAGAHESGGRIKAHAPKQALFRLRHDGDEIDVPASEWLVGRAVDCGLRLAGGLVSRYHARFRHCPEGLVLEDLGSRNGVLVNQITITAATLLKHGDTIVIGLDVFELIDTHMVDRPAHLSTLNPPPMSLAESDVEGPEVVTRSVKLDGLTEREREVLELTALGFTRAEMGQRLHISVKTIETYRARLQEKLACRTRAELVTYAIAAGVLRSK
jgi:DNA-binding CsgD family transcriptional regulator